MKSISKLADLRQFGIITLTGEADHLGFRILCDLTPQGKRIVEECYGMGFHAENWNHSEGQTASAMIPWWAWKELAIVALFLEGHTVLMTDDAVFGLESGDEYRRAEYDWNDEKMEATMRKPAEYRLAGEDEFWMWPESCYGTVHRIFENGSSPHVGTRNVHQFSGRAS